MQTQQAAAEAIDVALARSVLYRVLTAAFQEPTTGALTCMASPDDNDTIELAGCVANACPADDRLRAAAWHVARALPADPSVLAVRYARLFGHTARGTICPHETEYGADGLFHQPNELADIAGYYLAFGLKPRPGVDDRPDQIGCECEFMDFLCRKEAFLIGLAEDPDATPNHRATLEETQRTARTFLQRHLARFGLAVGARLTAEDPDGFYGRLGELLVRFLEAECARFGIAPGPASLELRSTAADEVPIGCGTGDELIQIQGLGRRRQDSESQLPNPESRIPNPFYAC